MNQRLALDLSQISDPQTRKVIHLHVQPILFEMGYGWYSLERDKKPQQAVYLENCYLLVGSRGDGRQWLDAFKNEMAKSCFEGYQMFSAASQLEAFLQAAKEFINPIHIEAMIDGAKVKIFKDRIEYDFGAIKRQAEAMQKRIQ